MFGQRSGNRRRSAARSRPRLPLPRIPWRRLWGWSAMLGGVAALAAAVLWSLNQPIRTLAISGRFERVSPLEVQRAVKHSAQGRGLVSVDLGAVRDAVRALPWVDSVSVQRSWPHGLAVGIVEQAAAGRWGGGGLLNLRGELFATDDTHIPPELPLLSGPPGTQALVVQRYLAMHGRLLEAGMRMTALRLDARGSWELELDNGVTVRLGRKQLERRFDTFMATAVKIVAQRATDIAYVDMRYANGFAIGWRGAGVHEQGEGGERNV